MGSAIVIGGGPNGLAAAASLAAKGHQVTLLEARTMVGGRAASEEFHPGYHTTGLLHDTERIQPWVIDALGLRKHGLKTQAPPPVAISGPKGRVVLLPSEEAGAWREDVQASAAAVRALSAGPPPDIRSDAELWPLVRHGARVLRLGRARVMELLRTGPLSAEDWLEEWFQDPTLQAGLALPGLLGTWMGPRSPTSAAAVLFSAALSGEEVVGGPAGLVQALAAACAAHGVEIRTGALVKGIRVQDARTTGVTLDDGTEQDAELVLSCLGPRQTLRQLVDPLDLPFAMDQASAPIRTRGIVAKVDLALSAPLRLAAHPDRDFERIRVAPDMVTLERAFDDAKHRRLPRAPALDIRLPTLSDSSLAPEGHHVASILVYGVAHDLDGGWTEDAREALGEVTKGVLEKHMPGSQERIIACRVQSPADLEDRLGLEGGHLFHGELSLDQIMSFRPHPSLAHYSTGIQGLFLGGAGMHPAGGLTCAQGVLGARAAN